MGSEKPSSDGARLAVSAERRERESTLRFELGAKDAPGELACVLVDESKGVRRLV